jgi:hypothetical protein
MEAIWLQGRLEVRRSETPLGVAGYTMHVVDAVKQL